MGAVAATAAALIVVVRVLRLETTGVTQTAATAAVLNYRLWNVQTADVLSLRYT